jgi:hypothetical protein
MDPDPDPDPDPTPFFIDFKNAKKYRSGSTVTPDPTPFYIDFKNAKKKYLFSYFFLITCSQAHHLQSKILNFFAKLLR